MADPTNRTELHRAITAAAILEALRDAELFDLTNIPFQVNAARIAEIKAMGEANDINPALSLDHAGNLTDHDGPIIIP